MPSRLLHDAAGPAGKTAKSHGDERMAGPGYIVTADPEGIGFCSDWSTGNRTPVRSSETAHSRCWTATSYDSGLEVTSRGGP